MTTSTLLARALASREEREQHCRLTEEAFFSPPTPEGFQRHLRFFQTLPNFQPEQWRGVFLAGKFVGGCFISSRLLRIGTALLPTGCIGAVVTDPSYRKRGVASTLMQDATNHAQTQQFALLMLDGIADFYHRYGYIDIFDNGTQEVQSAAILEHEPGSYTVRLVTDEDAAHILTLYERHYSHYTGSFVRTLEEQRHRLRNYVEEKQQALLAFDGKKKPCGYLLLPRDLTRPAELAADDWEATLALTQYHARMFAHGEAPEALRYRIASQAPVTQRLIDRLSLPVEVAEQKSWVVRGQTIHCRRAGWMARIGHMPTLLEALLPMWQTHWQRTRSDWSGSITFVLDKESFALRIDKTGVRFCDQSTATYSVRLTPQAFTQLIFGYRSIGYLLQEAGQQIVEEVREALAILFPSNHVWITPSDWF